MMHAARADIVADISRFEQLLGTGRGAERPEDLQRAAVQELVDRYGPISDRQRIVLDTLVSVIGPGEMTAATVGKRSGTNAAGAARTLRSLQEKGLVTALRDDQYRACSPYRVYELFDALDLLADD